MSRLFSSNPQPRVYTKLSRMESRKQQSAGRRVSDSLVGLGCSCWCGKRRRIVVSSSRSVARRAPGARLPSLHARSKREKRKGPSANWGHEISAQHGRLHTRWHCHDMSHAPEMAELKKSMRALGGLPLWILSLEVRAHGRCLAARSQLQITA
ncbi:hypothetical protein VTK56DRAFT_3611 [Thermocarpiscus australiensis]